MFFNQSVTKSSLIRRYDMCVRGNNEHLTSPKKGMARHIPRWLVSGDGFVRCGRFDLSLHSLLKFPQNFQTLIELRGPFMRLYFEGDRFASHFAGKPSAFRQRVK